MASNRAIIWCAVSTGAQAEDDRVSLPAQEADARKLAETKAWEIVDLLSVPGHSRRYKDFNVLAEAAAHKGIDAFYRLQEHWKRQDFDYLICRDGDRFARSQTLFARITEEIVETAKARIWSLNDGLIDRNNYRMWIAMRGLQAASDIDKLVKYRDAGMNERGAKGLPVSSQVPLSHKLMRDERGKASRLAVNEDRRRLWDDLATLILEGVSWAIIDHELYERYGHVDALGREFGAGCMYNLVMNPMFWGHTARHWRARGESRKRYSGLWLFDDTEPAPEGVTVWRNTVEPVYTGEIAEQVKAELRRRVTSMVGHARPSASHRYTSLFVCGECSSVLGTCTRKPRHSTAYKAVGLRCNSAYKKSRSYYPCSQKAMIPYRVIDAYIHARLRELLDGMSPDIFQSEAQGVAIPQKRMDVLRAELDDVESRIGRLIYEQSAAPDAAQGFYREQIANLSEQAERLRQQVAQTERGLAASTQQSAVQAATIEELRAMSLDAFWKQSDNSINQMLHKLLGKNQFVVLDRQIVGITERRRRRPTKRGGDV